MSEELPATTMEALTLLRQDATTSAVVSKCQRIADSVRKEFLVARDWNFARAVVSLSGGTRRTDGTTAFARPASVLKVIDLRGADGARIGWRVEGQALVVDSGVSSAKATVTQDADPDGFPPLARAAFVRLLARELAIPVTGRQTDLKDLSEAYAERLRMAAAADFQEGNPGDSLVRQVCAIVSSELALSATDLADAADAIKRKLDDIFDGAVEEVLGAHPWRFARKVVSVATAPAPLGAGASYTQDAYALGACHYQRPRDCLRICHLKDARGDLLDWRNAGDHVASDRPAATITYIRLDKEVDKWPPLVRRALLYRLASDVAVAAPNRAKDPHLLHALYDQKLRDAILQDAREGNPGRSAWSGSRYVRAMRGTNG